MDWHSSPVVSAYPLTDNFRDTHMILLVEKYKPQKINEILGNAEILSVISRKDADLPHLLLTGPPGTGKTTLAHLLMKDCETLELNASDDRGIDVVREKIKAFCSKNVSRKLVILDECDSLTAAAQQALRRLMESSDTKFILVCNQLSKLIEPLQSRCALLRFSKIPPEAFKERIQEICAAEGIQLTSSGMEALVILSNGDIRACLNTLQGVLYVEHPIDGDFLYKLSGVPNYTRIYELFQVIRTGNVDELTRGFEALWAEKYESADLLAGFMTVAKNLESYEALKIIGKYHTRIASGIAGKLQFYGMFHEMIKNQI